jgi:hypothetical protein
MYVWMSADIVLLFEYVCRQIIVLLFEYVCMSADVVLLFEYVCMSAVIASFIVVASTVHLTYINSQRIGQLVTDMKKRLYNSQHMCTAVYMCTNYLRFNYSTIHAYLFCIHTGNVACMYITSYAMTASYYHTIL